MTKKKKDTCHNSNMKNERKKAMKQENCKQDLYSYIILFCLTFCKLKFYNMNNYHT